jgi:His-Xaa-Ser system radical SAM maturase HxsB
MLDFFATHNVFISTSLDGPQSLHDFNRPRRENDSHERVIANIRSCRERLGHDSVSALMTCSSASLDYPEAIIDEYVRQGFSEIFLRSMSPYGFAVRSTRRIGYETDHFLDFYRRGLDHILSLNKNGVVFRETFASIALRRMLTPYPTGYVDLQSPAGTGFGALVYNYNGNVYASDEGRMLAEMNDETFCLGNVHQNTWTDIYLESPILDMVYQTMTEGIPGCSECAFQPWCGSDPVRHHATQHDIVGHRPMSSFCKRHLGVFRYLVHLIEDDPAAARILRRWAQ